MARWPVASSDRDRIQEVLVDDTGSGHSAKPQQEPIARTAVELPSRQIGQLSTIGYAELTREVEAKAGALGSCREKRLEQGAARIAGNSGSVVEHPQLRPIGLGRRLDDDSYRSRLARRVTKRVI